ncbi:MAG TPA: ATP-binding protein [Candidatus Saccharimonadales bacterium]|nr:ATP-binding protein [Candidatus Saccharimonadales bacterium]
MLIHTSAKGLRFSTLGLFKKQLAPAAKLAEQRDAFPETAARQAVLRVLLRCTTYAAALFFLLLLVSYFVAGNDVAGPRSVVNGLVLVYLLITHVFIRPRKPQLAALLLMLVYIGVAALAMWEWGINLPFATLLMSVTITLAGIMLGARYSLYAAALLGAVTIAIQILTTLKVHVPNESWQKARPSGFGEALGYCLLFAVLGVVAWVFGRELERSLQQARSAEAAVQEQKQLLAVKLKERTRKLRALQLEEMQQLYRFAELGQLSTALLHELANHLTALTLDIDTLSARRRGDSIERAKQSIEHLDKLVGQVRRQLQDTSEISSFSPLQQMNAVATTLRPKFARENVLLDIVHRGSEQTPHYNGDAVRFCQVLTILLTNALHAASEATVRPVDRRVRMELHSNRTTITVRVSDWGGGIASAAQRQLFKPFYSTKQEGMGIGLFISKQIVQTHFKGTVSLESASHPTTFKVIFPARGRDDSG